MTKEEAQHIVANVSCSCDGYGVVPNSKGIIVKCPNCDGRQISNAEYKEARKVLQT